MTTTTDIRFAIASLERELSLPESDDASEDVLQQLADHLVKIDADRALYRSDLWAQVARHMPPASAGPYWLLADTVRESARQAIAAEVRAKRGRAA